MLDGQRRRMAGDARPPIVNRPFDAEVDRYLKTAQRAAAAANADPEQIIYRMAYLPPAEFAEAREQGLLDVSVEPDHADYRRELERAMRTMPGNRIQVMSLDVRGLLSYAEREGLDPALRETRLRYSEDLDLGTPWPPGGNDVCWCGSGRKYKKCCAAPAFLNAQPAPDRFVFRLKVELAGAEPPVRRRLLVPSRTPLDTLHTVLQSAMGWNNDHMYAFEHGDDSYQGNPYETNPETTEMRLADLVAVPGRQLAYRYDFGDDWLHTLTLEEVLDRDPDATYPRCVDGAGACPPEDSGGIPGYALMLAAARDPSHAEHHDAMERLGANFDPKAFDHTRADSALSGYAL